MGQILKRYVCNAVLSNLQRFLNYLLRIPKGYTIGGENSINVRKSISNYNKGVEREGRSRAQHGIVFCIRAF